MVNQSRSYVVCVNNISSGENIEYELFDADSDPLKAKDKAIKQAKSFVKAYSEDGNVAIFVMVYVDGQFDLYLDQNGDEDTIPIDWLD